MQTNAITPNWKQRLRTYCKLEKWPFLTHSQPKNEFQGRRYGMPPRWVAKRREFPQNEQPPPNLPLVRFGHFWGILDYCDDYYCALNCFHLAHVNIDRSMWRWNVFDIPKLLRKAIYMGGQFQPKMTKNDSRRLRERGKR